MAYTTPATWTVGEVVTASKMNTHVRDNIAYLKGSAGTIAFESGATFAGAITVTSSNNIQTTHVNSGADISSYLGMISTNKLRWALNRNPNSGTFDDTALSEARFEMDASTASSYITLSTASAANTQASERIRITGAGDVGIGTSAPAGQLHVAGAGAVSGAGMAISSVSAVTTVQTIFAAGTVARAGAFLVLDRLSAGGLINTVINTTAIATLSDDFTYTNTDTMTIAITAGGAVTVTRTGGTAGTHDVVILAIFL